MFNNIYCNPNHAFEAALPEVYVPARLTSLAVSIHSRYLTVPMCRAVQFGVQVWNSLDEPCFAGDEEAAFKSRINRSLLIDRSIFPSPTTLSYNFMSSGCQFAWRF